MHDKIRLCLKVVLLLNLYTSYIALGIYLRNSDIPTYIIANLPQSLTVITRILLVDAICYTLDVVYDLKYSSPRGLERGYEDLEAPDIDSGEEDWVELEKELDSGTERKVNYKVWIECGFGLINLLIWIGHWKHVHIIVQSFTDYLNGQFLSILLPITFYCILTCQTLLDVMLVLALIMRKKREREEIEENRYTD